MKHLTIAAALALSTTLCAQAALAEDGISVKPYVGAIYALDTMQFKTGTPYADGMSGFAPVFGVGLGKFFAIEGSYRIANGSLKASDTLSYHTSARGMDLALLVKIPIDDSGFAPFVSFGFSALTFKGNSLVVSTVNNKPVTTYTSLVAKSEVNPIGSVGLSYTYGGIELRGFAKAQPINMGNTGEYDVTFGGGVMLHV